MLVIAKPASPLSGRSVVTFKKILSMYQMFCPLICEIKIVMVC